MGPQHSSPHPQEQSGNSACLCPAAPAPTGRHVIAQGNALGKTPAIRRVLKGRNLRARLNCFLPRMVAPLQGAKSSADGSQGVALGYHMSSRWDDDPAFRCGDDSEPRGQVSRFAFCDSLFRDPLIVRPLRVFHATSRGHLRKPIAKEEVVRSLCLAIVGQATQCGRASWRGWRGEIPRAGIQNRKCET